MKAPPSDFTNQPFTALRISIDGNWGTPALASMVARLLQNAEETFDQILLDLRYRKGVT